MQRKPHWRESPPNGRKSPVNGTYQKGTGLIWQVLSGQMPRARPKTTTKAPGPFVVVLADAPMLLARGAVGVVQICKSKCAGGGIKVEFEHAAVADAVLHLERLHAHAAHNLSRCGAMAHA